MPEWFYKIFNYDWNYWSNPPHLYSIPSGNVGIGTDEPLSTLDIYDSDEPAEIRLASGLHGGSGTINFVNSGWIIRSGFATPPQSLGFRYGGDEVMTLKGENVGIGTTNPNATLDVEGDLEVSGAYKGNIGPDNGAPFSRPAYDSGFQPIGQNEQKTFYHNIGGDMMNYIVNLQFKDDPGANGVHNLYYGISFDGSNDYGVSWWGLTNESIIVDRGDQDVWAESVRVRIWVYN